MWSSIICTFLEKLASGLILLSGFLCFIEKFLRKGYLYLFFPFLLLNEKSLWAHMIWCFVLFTTEGCCRIKCAGESPWYQIQEAMIVPRHAMSVNNVTESWSFSSSLKYFPSLCFYELSPLSFISILLCHPFSISVHSSPTFWSPVFRPFLLSRLFPHSLHYFSQFQGFI